MTHTTAGSSSRPAVLFLHGFMGSAADWMGVTAALGEHFHCVSVDLPGHGSSTGLSSASYTMEGAALSVIKVLDTLRIEQATLVGYSMGGRVALYLALRHPERCAGLFVESASPGLENPRDRKARREADELRAKRLEMEDFGQFLEDWYRQPLFASLARDEELLNETIAARRSNDPAELTKSLRGMGAGSQPSLWEELPQLKVPALAVAGALDEKYVGIGQRMKAESPAIDFASVPGVGHNVRAEVPGAYTGLLRGFLESL
ncbi:MAG: 2-succinyl-6-hydroxy-2,4-cyclohexadiene-1-carboxylate synthase [Rubrobacteraceae bacterium]